MIVIITIKAVKIIENNWVCLVVNVKTSLVNVPRVLNISEDINEIDDVNKIFNPNAAMNLFAFDFSIIKVINNNNKVVVIVVKINPKIVEFRIVEKVYAKKAENPINPSKNKANVPTYSLNKAPKEAKIRGQENAKMSKIIISPLLATKTRKF